jgi:hypothetical protein
MTNQRLTDRLAPIGVTRLPMRTPKPAALDADDFVRRLADAARRILAAEPLMSQSEKQLLWDVQRGRHLVVLSRMVSVASRCRDTSAALAVPEAIRGFVIEVSPTFDAATEFSAFLEETTANGAADVAQMEHVISPSRATRERAIETLVVQEAATRKAIDALHRGEAAPAQRLALVG